MSTPHAEPTESTPQREASKEVPEPKADRLARGIFVLAAVFLVFLYGLLTGHFGWPPARFVTTALEQGRAWLRASSAPDHHFRPARHESAGVARPSEGTPVPGSTLLTGFWRDEGWQPALRLIDTEGKVMQEWPAVARSIWPKSAHTDPLVETVDPARSYVHGSYLFPNGDVLFSVEFVGLVRMNARGEVLWRLDRRTHHSVTRAEDGTFWVCAGAWRSTLTEVYPRWAGLSPPLLEDQVLQVSADGEVLREISMLDVLFASDLEDQIWRRGRTGTDLLHLNDVEPLSSAMAPEYPLFAAGDLLVSLRDVDLVLVFDPATSRVKWWVDRPFMRQHDPDFIGGGWISVYDNHPDGAPVGQFLGGSRVLELRPHTGEVVVRYCPGCTPRVGEARPFYSDLGGKTQRLDDGHWLITEPMAGRVFEIDGNGRTVWEWIQARSADGKSVSEVMEGTRYPYTAADVAGWRGNR
ncbi:MAG: arylsulfotransferase family protein [Planctomycetota bacterium]